MKSFKKLFALVLSVALISSAITAGTIAYLTSEDSDVNVMTLGNVKIEQHEYERVVENGIYKTDTIDNQTSYVLDKFSQNKPLYPIVGDPSKSANDPEYAGYDETTVRMTQVDSYGGMQVFAGKNAQDKFVTVENTGKSDAYVRTIVAVEVGNGNAALIGKSYHTTWTSNNIGTVEINGNNYYVTEYNYNGGQLSNGTWRHQYGILPAGDTTYPNLSQVYLKSEATNEDMVALDGNGNGMLDILVLSQAVQVEGFANAKAALDAGFGVANAENIAKWFGNAVAYDHVVDSLEGFKDALAEGGKVLLTSDIQLDKITAIEPGAEVYLNLNGNKITVDPNTTSNTLLYVKDGAKLVIDGDGIIDLGSVSTMAIFAPYGELVIENGTFIRDEVTTVTNKTTGLFMGAKTTSSNVTINGGYFDSGYYDENAAKIEGILAGTVEFDETADDIAKRNNSKDANKVRVALKDNVSALLNHSGYGSFKVYGGTFVGANPAWGDEGCMLPTTPAYLRPWSYYQGSVLDGQVFHEDGIVLPAGYTITNSVLADGRPVYTVNYNK